MTAKRVEDLPADELAYRAIKIHLLGALADDYVGTVLDIASQMREVSTRKAARKLRGLREDYWRTVSEDFTPDVQQRLKEVSLLFEELCASDLARFNAGMSADTDIAALAAGHKMLALAVQSAMTVIDTMRLFASEFDSWISRQGVRGRAVFPWQFNAISATLPEFAAGAYNPRAQPRTDTARALLDRINEVELYGD